MTAVTFLFSGGLFFSMVSSQYWHLFCMRDTNILHKNVALPFVYMIFQAILSGYGICIYVIISYSPCYFKKIDSGRLQVKIVP